MIWVRKFDFGQNNAFKGSVVFIDFPNQIAMGHKMAGFGKDTALAVVIQKVLRFDGIKGQFHFFARQACAATLESKRCVPITQPDAQFAPIGIHHETIQNSLGPQHSLTPLLRGCQEFPFDFK